MYYVCAKCKEKFGTTKPLRHGTLGIVFYPDENKANICDGKILELQYEEYQKYK